MKRLPLKLARFIQRHPVWFIIAAVIISAASVPGITMMKTETGFSALISPEDKISVDTALYQEQFGGEAITVLLTGGLDDIFSPDNLKALTGFQQELTADPQYMSVMSPLSVLEPAVDKTLQAAQALREQLLQAQDQAAEAARAAAAAAGLDEAAQEQAAEQARVAVLAKFQPQLQMLEQMGEPSLDNPIFIRSVLYDENGDISAAMKQFVPDMNHALVFVNPEGNMTDDQALNASRHIETVLSETALTNVTSDVVSYPELINAISTSMSSNLRILFGLSIAAMIIILLVLFRVRWRLLSLLMVGIGALWTFGLMGYLSVPLTMASMAVLPILIGQGIDFSIQFHNRYQEEITKNNSVGQAVITSISRMFPVVGIALLATIIGFITLYISEVPMIRDFGLTLAVGIIISYLTGLFLLNSVIVLADRRIPLERLQKAASKASSRIERVLLGLGKLAIRHTLWIFIIALLFAVGGGIVDHLLPVNTDYEQLMPQDNEALKELRQLREIVGVGGSITFMVQADDVTSPRVLTWMNDFQTAMESDYPDIVSTNSPADIVTAATGGTIPSVQQIEAILVNTPEIYRERIISADHTMAGMSFTIKHIPFQDIRDLIEHIESDAAPPRGVQISPVGSLVIGARTMNAVVGSRMKLNFICLGAIFVILLAIYRRLDKTLFSVLPVGVVIAWSSLDMYLIGIPLNPLTAILGVIVIGICTEFMVLLTGRYEEEKGRGLEPVDAMTTAISRIGRAITTTAVTTLGGFGVLIASNFVMVRDFGIATLIGVLLCLVITLTVMPGLIVWYDNLRLRRKNRQNSG
jgi:hydrophobe/amphiphile efflux-3 (HAE3) family protein